jgi:hypothetical protein
MGATSGPGTAYPSGAPAFTLIFSGVHVTRSLVVCVCFVDRCLSFCTFFFAIVLSVLGFTDSDYPFGITIFKLFFLSPINKLYVHWFLPFSLMCFGVCEWSEEWVVFKYFERPDWWILLQILCAHTYIYTSEDIIGQQWSTLNQNRIAKAIIPVIYRQDSVWILFNLLISSEKRCE